VEFGKHIGKGIWGIADKGLPVFYGLGYVLLVIRVLPQEEFGNFVLIQEVFLIASGLATAFALQPLLKFASEEGKDAGGVIIVSLLYHAGFLLVASGLLMLLQPLVGQILNAPSLVPLWPFIPAMLAASFVRNFALILLQSAFRVKEVFWVDAAHFVSAPLMVWGLSRMHLFNSARDLIVITLVSLSCSSALGLILSSKMLKGRLSPAREDYRKMWDYGKFSVGGLASYLVYSKADTFVLAGFTGPIQVAVYNSVKVFTRVFEMVGQVVQMFVLPASSMLSSRGEESSLRAVVEKAILFLTVGLLPVSFVFLFFPGQVLSILYAGRYGEAAPLLRIFALLSLVVPLYAVATNVLMGLGKAREGFMLGLAMLVVSVLAYFVFTPLWGIVGAAVGYVVASFVMGWLAARVLLRVVPFSALGTIRRLGDIRAFAHNIVRRITRAS
jgi:O-antigen/teichoic acid export membrane protein